MIENVPFTLEQPVELRDFLLGALTVASMRRQRLSRVLDGVYDRFPPTRTKDDGGDQS